MLRRFLHIVFSTFDTKMFQNIFVSKMMTSTRKGNARDAAPNPGTVVVSKLSLAASEVRKATMASIAKLLDNAAAKNGGRVPQGFIPKVIQQFSKVTPGLTRDQINMSCARGKRRQWRFVPLIAWKNNG